MMPVTISAGVQCEGRSATVPVTISAGVQGGGRCAITMMKTFNE